MTEIIASALLLLGAFLALLASVGLMRFPDLITRMHATTKSGALGISLIMAAVALAYSEPTVVARAIAVIIFMLLTAPIAAHAIGRAAYFVGIELWSGTVKDELKAHYNLQTGELKPFGEETSNSPTDDSKPPPPHS